MRVLPIRCALVISLLLAPQLGEVASAQSARVGYLIRMLTTSDAFRVRSQAAISLGRVDPSPEVLSALSRALRDDNASVRTAAASSLQRLGDPSALDALRANRRQSNGAARRAVASAIRALERAERNQGGGGGGGGSGADAQYYVGVGRPGTRPGVAESHAGVAEEFLRAQLANMDGVQLAPNGENNRQAQRALRRNRLRGYFIDTSIVSLEETAAGTRAVVSVILNTYPGRDMRAILQGSATVPGGRGRQAARAALEGALRGALRRLSQAMASSRR